MIQFEEFQYLVEEAILYFKTKNEDVAWDYARSIVNTQNIQNAYILHNNLLINKLKALYGEDLFHQIFGTIGRVCRQQITEKAILLFLVDWNFPRFKEFGNEEPYIESFCSAIKNIYADKNNIIRESYSGAFNKVLETIYTEVRSEYKYKYGHEYVATAKILMLLDPNKFIAWDNQIIARFNLPSKKPEDYEKFNIFIDNFINNFIQKEQDIKNYVYNNVYVKQNKIKKLLDMIFWITYNRKNVSLKFYCLTEKLVEDHILI